MKSYYFYGKKKILKNSLYKASLLFIISLLLWQCANVGMPSGGPKDDNPPVLIKSSPTPNALNFKKNKITLEFDELIKLKDLRENFIASPPFNDPPTVQAIANKVMIQFKEDLQTNTTYTLDFADAIVDNNEGNVLSNFSFSFSTGNIVDSLQVAGHVWDADDLSPSKGVQVFLHENLNDTAVQTLVPVRIGITDQFGYFKILNVKPGKYRLYALEDANRDYKFDQPGERMAWSDITVEPRLELKEMIDSISQDSIRTYDTLVYLPDSTELFLFQHQFEQQYLLSEERKDKEKLSFFFNNPLEKDAALILTGHDDKVEPFIMERSLKNDTVHFWIKDSTLYNKDSISVTLNYPLKDSLNQTYVKADTIEMYFFEVKDKKKSKRKKKEQKADDIPTIKLQDSKQKIDKFKTFNFSLQKPALDFNFKAVRLYEVVDSIKTPIDFTITQDTMRVRNYSISHKWEVDKKYELQIDSAAIKNIEGISNANITHQFSIIPLEDYGIIYTKILNPQPNWLIEVMSNDQVVQTLHVPTNGKAGFRYLTPKSYTIRIVEDRNMNGKWDTGDYYSKTQPEKIYYYPEKIQVRANWEHELEEWDPHSFSTNEFSRKNRKPKSKE